MSDPDWRPISDVPEAWRSIFCEYACSGMIPTNCARVVRHFYRGGNHSIPGKPVFHLPLSAIPDLYPSDIEPFEMEPLATVPPECWGSPGNNQIRWDASCWTSRVGEPNHQQRRTGTDLIDIRFDPSAAKDCGCPLQIMPRLETPSGKPIGAPSDPIEPNRDDLAECAVEMTAPDAPLYDRVKAELVLMKQTDRFVGRVGGPIYRAIRDHFATEECPRKLVEDAARELGFIRKQSGRLRKQRLVR